MIPTATHPFCRRLTEHRLSRGLSLYRLAQMSGISAPHLGKLEAGEAHPYLWTAQVLAAALGVPLDHLAGPLPTLPEAPPQKGRAGPRKVGGDKVAPEVPPEFAQIAADLDRDKPAKSPRKKRSTEAMHGARNPPPPSSASEQWKGEPIEPLGLTTDELNASAINCLWAGKRKAGQLVRIHPVEVNKEPWAVELLRSVAGNSQWRLWPLMRVGVWHAMVTPGAEPTTAPEPMEREGRTVLHYSSTAVRVGACKWVIGPAYKCRVVVSLNQQE